ARVRELDKAATPGPWESQRIDDEDGEIHFDLVGRSPGQFDFLFAVSDALNENAKTDAAFIAFSRTALPDLATLAEQAIAQNDNYHAAVQVLHSRLEAEHARAEKAEADLAEARRMLKEADAVVYFERTGLAGGVLRKFQLEKLADEAIARHQAREGERKS